MGFAAKICERCGRLYEPSSGSQKFCLECREKLATQNKPESVRSLRLRISRQATSIRELQETIERMRRASDGIGSAKLMDEIATKGEAIARQRELLGQEQAKCVELRRQNCALRKSAESAIAAIKNAIEALARDLGGMEAP